MSKIKKSDEPMRLSQVFTTALLWPVFILIYDSIRKPLAGRLKELCLHFVVLYIGAVALGLIEYAFMNLLRQRKRDQAEANEVAREDNKDSSFGVATAQALLTVAPLMVKFILLDMAKDWLNGRGVSFAWTDVKFGGVFFVVILLLAAVKNWTEQDGKPEDKRESESEAKKE